MFDDEYHIEARKRSKDFYHNKGGKEKMSLRRYMKRYDVDESTLNMYDKDEDKLEFLRAYSLISKIKNKDILYHILSNL
jgi:hypothetical protein